MCIKQAYLILMNVLRMLSLWHMTPHRYLLAFRSNLKIIVCQSMTHSIGITWLTTLEGGGKSTIFFFFYRGATALVGSGLLIIEDLRSHSDTPNYPPAETSSRQHITLTRDGQPSPRRDSNPQSQQASGRRPTPQTARPLAIRNFNLRRNQVRERGNSGESRSLTL